MRWIDVVWSAVAGACCTFAIVHGLVWWRRREAVLNGLFSLIAVVAATLALTEQRLLNSDSIDAYAFWLRLYMVPVFLLLVALLLYTRRSMPAAKHWLGWLAISLRVPLMLILFFDGSTRLYFEITALRKPEFFGQPLAVVSTTTGPLVYVGQASLALFTIYLVDAARCAWRAGFVQRARLVGAFALLFALGIIWSHFSLWHDAQIPYVVMPVFVPIVLLVGVELSANLLRTDQLESRLRESERQLSLAVDSAKAGLWQIDVETGEIWANARTHELANLRLGESAQFKDFVAIVHPDDRRRFMHMFRDDAGGYRVDASLEFRVVLPGGEIRWYSSHGRRVVGDDDGRTALWGVTIDITERKRSEEERLRRAQQMERLSRLAIMGELAAVVAHEINQPLAVVLSNAETAQMLLADANPNLHEVRMVLDEVVAADARAAAIVKRFRGLLQHRDPQLQSLNLRTAITGVLTFLRSELQRRGVRVEFPPDEFPSDDTDYRVAYDPVRLDQVLVNLIVNGCDAMSANAPGDRVLALTLVRAPFGVVVSVKDIGVGLRDGAETLFEPFYTTKPEGLGLGLAIARSIVEAHGGTIWVTAGEDRGVTFSFSIPAPNPAAGAVANPDRVALRA
ncbi:MAG: PAS domain S-box protein [Gammaproteobacteria bacterium]|nr:PAS domain S-box protein [Gammaproteobacteria bacterium]